MTSLKQELLSYIKQGFRTKKRLGQHFLIDDDILNQEVAFGNVEGEKVLEVGAGFGFLTRKLAEKAEKVLAVEMDENLKPYLTENLKKYDNVEIIWDDVLNISLPDYKVVSNIPYQISSPLTFKLLENGNNGVICYQKEFAERMIAKPGTRDYSRLSATVSFLAEVNKLSDVPRTCFWPEPEVDSTLLEFKSKNKPENWKEIKELIDTIFLYPNKKISKVGKITGIEFPERFEDLRVREMSPDLLVVAVNFLK